MVESEPVLPVSSAFVRVAPLELLQSNRWEAEPRLLLRAPLLPPAGHARKVSRSREKFPSASRVFSGDLMKLLRPVAEAWTPTVSSDEETSAEALIRNTCDSSHYQCQLYTSTPSIISHIM